MEKINLLWTGGWDSTYRLIELSRENVEVTPIYLYGDGRKSEKNERDAMEKILSMLKERKETVAKLNPIKFVNINELKHGEDIKKAYKVMKKATQTGSQYEHLANYARILGERIEIGVEKAPDYKEAGIQPAIRKFGKVIETENVSRLRIDPQNSTKELIALLGKLDFPILDKTEHDMLNNVKEWGYEDIMKNIWFCHSPIDGKPCGICNPCKQKIESDMEFLLSKEALHRYNKVKSLQKVFGRKIARKIVRRKK